uniref:Uncharacterized protein n=1 Tax=Trypanosoma congolense (strain IL3000) TaxID=1068625 RepID=G0ULD5_TRYCI|nr:conserved hypothetical protein [Trypanosoma congolense IL3000]
MAEGNRGDAASPAAAKRVAVSIAPHCDLLHFAGSTPHPYAVISLQTVTQRAAGCVRFSLNSSSGGPSVTASCNQPLFTPTPVPKVGVASTSIENGPPHFPLSGVGLARRAFEENFESSTQDREVKHGMKRDRGGAREEEPLPDGSDAPKKGSGPETSEHTKSTSDTRGEPAEPGETLYEVNFSFVRRVLLQVLLTLSIPERSPAAAFLLRAHDPCPGGGTTFLVLPRSAEQLRPLAHPVQVSFTVPKGRRAGSSETAPLCCALQCSCSTTGQDRAKEGTLVVDDGAPLCAFPLLWCVSQKAMDPSQLQEFLTKAMVPLLYTVPAQLRMVAEEKLPALLTAFLQRRSFHLMALIAHCVWCEKIARYVLESGCSLIPETAVNTKCTAELKSRDEVSLEGSGKWETTLTFCYSSSNDREGRERLVAVRELWVTVRGCDDAICWGRGDAKEQGVVQDLGAAVR